MNPQGFPLRRSSSCHWVHTSTTLLCSTCERSVSASFLFLFSPSWASQTLQGSPTRELRSQANIPGCLSSEAVKRKGDFVFQTGHVIEIVTKLFLVVQNATGKPPTVNINTQFDANFGTHSVTFQFKASIILRIQLKLNTALLSTVCPCVRPSVRHRRDISHFKCSKSQKPL